MRTCEPLLVGAVGLCLACSPAEPMDTSETTQQVSGSSSGGDAPTTTGATDSTDSSGDASTGDPAEAQEIVVCDFFGDAVHRFDAATGELLGTWKQAPQLDGALGVVVGPDGHVYVASEEFGAVLRFDGATGAFLDVFVADDPTTPDDESGGLKGPGAVLFGPDGALYVSSFDSDAILRYDGATGAFLDAFVEGGAGGLDGPDAGMVFGPDGALYVPSYYTDQVLRFDGLTGEPLGAFTPADGSLSKPRTLLFTGDHLLVTSEGGGEVVRFDASTGAFIDLLVPKASGTLGEPSGMALAADGTLLVASITTSTIEAFDVATGEHLGTRVPKGDLKAPTHMLVRPRG